MNVFSVGKCGNPTGLEPSTTALVGETGFHGGEVGKAFSVIISISEMITEVFVLLILVTEQELSNQLDPRLPGLRWRDAKFLLIPNNRFDSTLFRRFSLSTPQNPGPFVFVLLKGVLYEGGLRANALSMKSITCATFRIAFFCWRWIGTDSEFGRWS
jgi:hypothetical protein